MKTSKLVGIWLFTLCVAYFSGLLGLRPEAFNVLYQGKPTMIAKGPIQAPASSMPSEAKPVMAEFPSWFALEEISSAEARSILSEIMDELDPLQQDWQYAHLLKKLTPENSWGAWDVIKANTDPIQNARRVSLFGIRWGQIHGEAAMKAMARGDSPWAQAMGVAACEGWGQHGQDEAAAWFEAHPNAVSSNMRMAFLKGLARTSPEDAGIYLETLTELPNSHLYVAAVATACLQEGFEKAEEWVVGLANPRFRKDGFHHLAKGFVSRDLEGASAWALNYAHDPDAAEAIAHVAEAKLRESLSSAPTDLPMAMEWVADLPEGNVKNFAYARCLHEWGRRSPNDAAEYLSQLSPSPAKDHALRSFAIEVMLIDPEAAVHWASTIGNPDERTRTLVAGTRYWLDEDAEAANSWLSDAKLPDEVLLSIHQPDE